MQINSEILNEISTAAKAQAERQLELFGGIAELGKDDLVQHLTTIALAEVLPKYDASRGAKLSTYLNGCFRRRLIDLWRSKNAAQKRDQVVGIRKISKDSGNNSDRGGNYLSVDGDCTLEELGQRAMKAACQVFPKYAKTGPHKFTCWQLLATVMVMEAREESTRGMLHLIRTSRSLRDALGYDGALPTHQRLKQFIQRFEEKTGHKFKRARRITHCINDVTRMVAVG